MQYAKCSGKGCRNKLMHSEVVFTDLREREIANKTFINKCALFKRTLHISFICDTCANRFSITSYYYLYVISFCFINNTVEAFVLFVAEYWVKIIYFDKNCHVSIEKLLIKCESCSEFRKKFTGKTADSLFLVRTFLC